MRDVVIYSDNGSLEDLTTTLNTRTANSKAFTFTASEDAIYIGSLNPFTSKYLRQTVQNSNASDLTLQYWDGDTWRDASHTRDETSPAGTPFASSGYVSFTTDKRYCWKKEDTTDNGSESVTGLGGITLYNMYWVKLTYSADIDMTLDWVGDMFCTDEQIRDMSPRVLESEFMDDWESGKTDWEDQRAISSDLLISEMQTINLDTPNMLLDKSELYLPAIYRTLAVIYNEMGDDERAERYMNRVDVLLRQSFTKDVNGDGIASKSETGIKTKRMVR